jgi:hypothetical protein
MGGYHMPHPSPTNGWANLPRCVNPPFGGQHGTRWYGIRYYLVSGDFDFSIIDGGCGIRKLHMGGNGFGKILFSGIIF